MIQKLYERFVELGTRFKHRSRTDPFFIAGLKITGLYFLVGSMVFVVFGWIFGYYARQPLYKIALVENGAPVQQAIALLEQELLLERFVMIVVFAIAAYFLTDFVLRPIKKSAELQQRFAAIVSHELRTPVTIIKNASEIALRNEATLTHEKAVMIIKSNLEEINRLSETMEFLLTFTELKNQEHTSDLLPVSLTTIADKLLPVMKELTREYGVTVSLTAPEPYIILGNQTALEGMLLNLVKNAIYHSPSGSEVLVTIEPGYSTIRLSVKDSGSGIEKKDLPYIFEPFYRGKNQTRAVSARKGAGLGLSIVKEIAELHRAVISVSTTKDKGSVFTITFPTPVAYPQTKLNFMSQKTLYKVS